MSIKQVKKLPLLGCFALLMAVGLPDSEPAFDDSLSTKDTFSACNSDNTSFKVGEEMVYKLYYNLGILWLSAGEVKFKVEDLGNEYKFSALGTTYKSYEWFYKVKDYYETHVDKKTLLPTYSLRDINEGKYRLYDEITFDQASQLAISKRGKTKEEAVITTYPIESCMHDILSIFYFSRNLNFGEISMGSIFPIKIFIDKEIWPLQLEYRGREADKKIKGLGKFKTLLFGPEVIEGYYFKKDTEMNIWVTDDNNKIPLMIESPVSVGSVKAVLKSYSGLRHDMEAALK